MLSKCRSCGYKFSILDVQPAEKVGELIITQLVSIARRPRLFRRLLGSKYKVIQFVGLSTVWHNRVTGERAPYWVEAWLSGYMAVKDVMGE